MVIYFVLISLMSAQIAISEGMRRKISQEMAERNSKAGFDTSGTIASDRRGRCVIGAADRDGFLVDTHGSSPPCSCCSNCYGCRRSRCGE